MSLVGAASRCTACLDICAGSTPVANAAADEPIASDEHKLFCMSGSMWSATRLRAQAELDKGPRVCAYAMQGVHAGCKRSMIVLLPDSTHTRSGRTILSMLNPTVPTE
jgi:hypothetical protein